MSEQVSRTVAIRDGRTSSETLRHDVDGRQRQPGTPWSTPCWTGSAGCSCPASMIEPLGMRDRVRLEQEPDHIGVWAGHPAPRERQDPA